MGFSHPAIDTRDTALFLPFRKTLKAKKLVPLPDLVRYFMARKMGGSFEDPVRPPPRMWPQRRFADADVQLEQARAALDLFRSTEELWERIVAQGSWPCDLPPSSFASCFT
jgi:RNA exonuclease 4